MLAVDLALWPLNIFNTFLRRCGVFGDGQIHSKKFEFKSFAARYVGSNWLDVITIPHLLQEAKNNESPQAILGDCKAL